MSLVSNDFGIEIQVFFISSLRILVVIKTAHYGKYLSRRIFCWLCFRVPAELGSFKDRNYVIVNILNNLRLLSLSYGWLSCLSIVYRGSD
jgi:hypothetical protein